MSDATPTRDPLEVIERAVRKLAASGGLPGVISVVLFGSRAEGRSHRESDIDLAVLLDRTRYPTAAARFAARLALSGALIHALRDNTVDLVVLNDSPPLLARRVVTEGRRLLCADPEADRCFTRDVLLRAADVEPFLRKFQGRKLAGLAR